MATYAVVRFPNQLVFSQTSITEQLKRDIRYAQTLALSIDTTPYSLTTLANSYTITPAPPLGAINVIMPTGITLTPKTVIFDTLGNPGTSTITINVQATGLSNKSVVVTAETGYVP